MIGAIIGDVVGSCYEFNNINEEEKETFELFKTASTFTDDTVLTVATADEIMNSEDGEDGKTDFLRKYQSSYFDYPNRGWGGMFNTMAQAGNLRPYDSYGNGSAMRVSPCGWIHKGLEATLASAQATAEVTHSHPEGIKGAQAIAASIWAARMGYSKSDILDYVVGMGYPDAMNPLSSFPRVFDETCQGTIPLCMALFNESTDYEDAIRLSIAQGGDCDTTACIVGGIAEAFYGQPPEFMIDEVYSRLPNEMRRTVTKFLQKYCYNNFEEPTVRMDEETKLMDAFRSLFSN